MQGSGEAKGRPTEVEITGSLAGDSELAADAVVKFHDAKKKALAAMDALKNPNLSVISEGIAINSPIDANAQQMMMRGQTVTPTQKVQVQETSRIVLANTDKIEPEALLEQVLKILDVAKDSGFVIGPPSANNYYEMQMRTGQPSSMVVFKLPDASALRDAATKLAVEDAKNHRPENRRSHGREARPHPLRVAGGRQDRFQLAGDVDLPNDLRWRRR